MVLKGTHKGVPLTATGYKYNKKTILYFISSENSAPTVNGDPYEMKWTDKNKNVHVRQVPRPELVSFFFEHINAVDIHNHLRQYCLKLEKKWVTKNGYFRLATTLTGMNVVDTYRLSRFHSLLPKGEHFFRMKLTNLDLGGRTEEDIDDDAGFTMRKFAGVLAKQLLFYADGLTENNDKQDRKKAAKSSDKTKNQSFINLNNSDCSEEESDDNQIRVKTTGRRKKLKEAAMRRKKEHENMILYGNDPMGQEDTFVNYDSSDSLINRNVMYWNKKDDSQTTTLSSLTTAPNKNQANSSSESDAILAANDIIATYTNAVGDRHSVAKYESTTSSGRSTKGKNYIKMRQCQTPNCNKKSATFCYECNETHCYPLRSTKGSVTYCCFQKHVNNSWKTKKTRK